MITPTRWLITMAIAVAFAGCATHPPEAAAPAPPVATVADRLLESLERMRTLDETALAAEGARARLALEHGPGDDFARIEAAVALMLSPAGGDAEIAALIAPLLQEGANTDPALRSMAGFLLVMSHERRKLSESLAAAQARTRDDRREVLAQKTRADAQQERADRLQQKLDALTNLEKSLARRRPAPPTR